MIQLTTNVLGVFALRDGNIVKSVRFPDDPVEIAERLSLITNSVCQEEIALIKELNITELLVDNPARFRSEKRDTEFKKDDTRVDAYAIAEQIGVDRGHITELVRKVNIELTRGGLKIVDRDQILMQAVNALDDIEEVSNRMVERLREWYSIHYPELDHLVSNHELYANLVYELGDRKNYTVDKLTVDRDFRKKIVDSTKDSLGAEFTDEDTTAVKDFAKPLVELHEGKKKLEDYVDKLMDEIAPNMKAVVGPLLGARLISLAGGLKRISTLPAGTIQILGAEDAFFRFMKTGEKPPKHGIIFQYPAIRSASKDVRGKLARTLAAKIALASRADAFKGEFIGDRLSRDFGERVKTLRK